MFRITKKADYAVFILAYLAKRTAVEGPLALVSAQELASLSALNKSLVANLLKDLTKAGILGSVRGARGGYFLQRPAAEIDFAAILEVVEGPFSFVECAHDRLEIPIAGSEATAGVSPATPNAAASNTAASNTAASTRLADDALAHEPSETCGTEAGENDAKPAATGLSHHDHESCALTALCGSRAPMLVLHARIQHMLRNLSLAELAGVATTAAAAPQPQSAVDRVQATPHAVGSQSNRELNQ